MFDIEDYPFEIHRFSKENGGGFLISYPDFSECIADGETVTEAISNGREALLATIKTLEANGFSVTEPSFA
jgi:antitoxin HicB